MALEHINVGNFINDGTGDDLRTAFLKVNSNFDELSLQQGQNNTVANIGTGVGIYKEKTGVEFKLKSLIAGQGIDIVPDDNEILIVSAHNAFVTVNADTGNITANGEQSINIVGGTGVNTAISGNTLIINGSTYTIESDTTPVLGGNLNVNNYNIFNANTITSNTFSGNLVGNVTGTLSGQVFGNVLGNLTGNVNGINVTSLNAKVNDLDSMLNIFDFGFFNSIATNPIQWLLSNTVVDMGSIVSPNPSGIDGGSIV